MQKVKTTDEVDELLKKMKPSQLEEFYRVNRDIMVDDSRAFYYYVKDVTEGKNIRLKDMYLYAGYTESYGSQIIRMEKHTSTRDVIIRLCTAGHFSVNEMNKALKLYGMSPLYSKNRRDVIIILELQRGNYDLYKIDEILEKNGQARLMSE